MRAVDEIQTAFRKWNCICGAFYAYAEGKYGGRLAEVPDGASAAMATIHWRIEKLMRILSPIIDRIFRIRLAASLCTLTPLTQTVYTIDLSNFVCMFCLVNYKSQ